MKAETGAEGRTSIAVRIFFILALARGSREKRVAEAAPRGELAERAMLFPNRRGKLGPGLHFHHAAASLTDVYVVLMLAVAGERPRRVKAVGRTVPTPSVAWRSPPPIGSHWVNMDYHRMSSRIDVKTGSPTKIDCLIKVKSVSLSEVLQAIK